MGIMSPRNEIVKGDQPTTYGSHGKQTLAKDIAAEMKEEFKNFIYKQPNTQHGDTFVTDTNKDNVEHAEEKNCFIDKIDQKGDDPVHHPAHYTAYKGVEVIQLTEQMNFNRGNAVKYIARAGLKSKETEVQDLQKAAWYIKREIERLRRNDYE